MRYCLPLTAALVVTLPLVACGQDEAGIKTDVPMLGVYR